MSGFIGSGGSSSILRSGKKEVRYNGQKSNIVKTFSLTYLKEVLGRFVLTFTMYFGEHNTFSTLQESIA